MDNKWLWIGGAALLAVLYFVSRSGSSGAAEVVPGKDTTQETQARFSFAASGLQSLSQLASSIVGYQSAEETQIGVAQAQADAVASSSAAQASAQKYTASQAEKAQNNAGMWGAIGTGISTIGQIFRGSFGPGGSFGPSFGGGYYSI